MFFNVRFYELKMCVQFNEVMGRKSIVERDKKKIAELIEELDEKKKEALRTAWTQVNKDFGSIFGSLLPGAQAALKPPKGLDMLDGLEVRYWSKHCFNLFDFLTYYVVS